MHADSFPRFARTGGLVAAGLLIGWLATSLVLHASLGADYPFDARPGIDALADLDFGAFVESSPLMGPFSLFLRAPFVALSDAFGGSELWDYRLGIVPCLLVAAGLALLVAWLARRRGQAALYCVALVWFWVIGPVNEDALIGGHPEEFLAGSLAVSAVIAAVLDRTILAAVLLGLAVATKQWALVAVAPTLVAAPRAHLRLGLVALGIAVILYLPQAAGNWSGFKDQTSSAADASVGTTDHASAPAKELTIWWPLLTRKEQRLNDGVENITWTRYEAPFLLRRYARPGIVVAAVLLSLLYLRRRRERPAEDALALLALAFLLRCLLDPYDAFYYHVPFFMALSAWEVMSRRSVPVLAVVAALATWVMSGQHLDLERGDQFAYAYLAWSVPLAALLTLIVFAPRRVSERISRALGPSLQTPGDQPRWTNQPPPSRSRNTTTLRPSESTSSK